MVRRMTVIRVRPDNALGRAESLRAASRLGRDVAGALAAGRAVSLDFREVSSASARFVRALLAPAVEAGGLAALDAVSFEWCCEQVVTATRFAVANLAEDLSVSPG